MFYFSHLELSNPYQALAYIITDRGAISFLKPNPKQAPAKGSFPLLNSSNLAKLTKIP